jgi:alpha-1,3-rhamnosyl/mannosyltransferase
VSDTTPIGINLLWCIPGAVGGSEEYVARQLTGLAGLPEADDLAITLFTTAGFPAAHPDLAAAYRTRAAATDGRRRSVRVAYEHTWLLARTREARLRLVHHAGGTMPRFRAAPGVLTIHDLQYLAFPQFFSLTKLAYLRTAVPQSVKRAAAISVPSAFVRKTVADAFSYPADRIVVSHHGVDGALGTHPFDELQVRRRYGVPGRFLVYPAITHPHKNHVALLRAFAGLGPDADDVVLVLLGGAGTADVEVTTEIHALGLDQRVRRPGRVPAADRDALIGLATLLVFPSRYEGFGAPLLEAMALGCPVIASDVAAVPEVLADAGVLLPPLDTTAWRDTISSLLGDDGGRVTLAQRGRARASAFTAESSGRSLLRAYRLVA